MQTLSATLTAAQANRNYERLCKIVLSKSNTRYGYDLSDRLLNSSLLIQPDSHSAQVALRNTDASLSALTLSGYQGVISHGYKTGVARSIWVKATAYSLDDIVTPTTVTGYQYRCSVAGTSHATTEPTWPTALGAVVTDGTVTWEMDGVTGSEYARTPPLRVKIPDFFSSHGTTAFSLNLIGIPNQLAEDEASSTYTQTSSSSLTIKTLFTAVAEATLAPYTHCTAFTVDYDSEDDLIDTFKPADFFRVYVGEDRWSKLKWLLAYTKCVMRIGVDGHIHVSSPTVSGTSYDYTFDDDYMDADAHTFFNKRYRSALVMPNKVIVQSHSDHKPFYSGEATSSVSYGLLEKTKFRQMRLTSNAQGTNIAKAMIQKFEQDAEKGTGVAPMNVGQEIFDYVDIIDSVQSDERSGNVGYIRFDVGRGRFSQTFGFGKLALGSLIGMGVSGGSDGTSGSFSYDQVVSMINDFYDALNNMADVINALEARRIIDTWHVTEQLNIPSEALET